VKSITCVAWCRFPAPSLSTRCRPWILGHKDAIHTPASEMDSRQQAAVNRFSRRVVRRECSIRGMTQHNRNLHSKQSPDQNGTMRIRVKLTLAILLCGLALCVSWAQEGPRPSRISGNERQGENGKYGRKTDRTLSPDDRLSVIAAALDSKARPERDCSHLVHAIYERAGFTYAYASSSDLYVGVEGFQRVTRPQPGDLVVWRGHVGIVIRPSRHVFFSLMRTGPGIDDYEAPYWTNRGRARFYRFVKK